MRYFLTPHCSLKRLEVPSVYNVRSDEPYELDRPAFTFLQRCADEEGCSSEGCDREFLEYTLKEGILTDRKVRAKRSPIEKSPVERLVSSRVSVSGLDN